jgi:hypothetical protein
MDIPFPKTNFALIDRLQAQVLNGSTLMAALELGLFEVLERKALSLEQVAEATDTLSHRLDAVLDFCVAHDLLCCENGLYSNTPLASEFLVRSSPLFQGTAMRFNAYFLSMCAQNTVDLLRNEKNERAECDEQWGDVDAIEGMAQVALAGSLQHAVQAMAELPGFCEFRTMCDIGGNHATFTMALIDRNPDLRGVVCDLRDVLKGTQERCTKMGYADRIETKPFDVFSDDLPEASYDLVLASHVLYGARDFEEHLGKIVQRIAVGLRPGGWFCSHHLDQNKNADAGDVSRLELMTKLSGYRTHFLPVASLRKAMTACGLEDIRVVKTDERGWATLVSGRKPK